MSGEYRHSDLSHKSRSSAYADYCHPDLYLKVLRVFGASLTVHQVRYQHSSVPSDSNPAEALAAALRAAASRLTELASQLSDSAALPGRPELAPDPQLVRALVELGALGALLADPAWAPASADGEWSQRVAQWVDLASLAIDVARAGQGGA